jgi:hypothetical protein
MDLIHRTARWDDFDAFWRIFISENPNDAPPPDSAPTAQALRHEWQVFMSNRATLTMVVEDRSRPADLRIVGIAQNIFVADRFVEYVSSGTPPGVNKHASRPLPDGSWPLLTPEELRRQNAHEGVNCLTTHWNWAHLESSVEEEVVRSYIDRHFDLWCFGYNYKRLLIGAVGTWNAEVLKRAGYVVLADYQDYYRGSLPAADYRPYLLHITREQARAREGVKVNQYFRLAGPQLDLAPEAQEVLFHAVLGYSNEEISGLLNISAGALKKRWDRVYDLVEARFPDFFPGDPRQPARLRGSQAHRGRRAHRGGEKRARLIEYVRSHLEELRPTLSPRSSRAPEDE